MTKAKTTTEKARNKRERETRELGGVVVRKDAVAYIVHRFALPSCKGKSEACGLDVRDERAGAWKRIERFPIDTEAEDGGPWAPSWKRVLETWGSGTYKFQWFKDDGGRQQTMGMSPACTFNDPDFPQLPAYRRVGAEPTKAAATAAAPPAPPPAGGVDLVGAVASAAKDGKIEVPVALLLVQLVQAQAVTAESMFRGWMAQEAARRQELEEDYERRRQRDAEWSRQENERTATFWAAQSKAARELTAARAASSDDGDDRVEALAESIETLAETVKAGQGETNTLLQEALKMFGPAIAQRFLSPQTPTLPAGGNGQGGG